MFTPFLEILMVCTRVLWVPVKPLTKTLKIIKKTPEIWSFASPETQTKKHKKSAKKQQKTYGLAGVHRTRGACAKFQGLISNKRRGHTLYLSRYTVSTTDHSLLACCTCCFFVVSITEIRFPLLPSLSVHFLPKAITWWLSNHLVPGTWYTSLFFGDFEVIHTPD